MQKAINRFWDWLFHPSIRWGRINKTTWFRHPSPGNVKTQQYAEDYKKPYLYSEKNVRYRHPVQGLINPKESTFVGDGVGVTVTDKLRSAGFLKMGVQHTQAEVETAKDQFKKVYGVPVEDKIHQNDPSFTIPDIESRESIRQYIEKDIKNQAEHLRQTHNPNVNKQIIENPEPVYIETLDMFDQPHLQQMRAELAHRLEQHEEGTARRGYIDIKKGDKNFWKALEKQNDPANIQKVQSHVGDDQPLQFAIEDTKIEFVKNQKGEVVDVNPKTKVINK